MFCPMCDNDSHTLLGILGECATLRCRDCGITFMTDVQALEDTNTVGEDVDTLNERW